MLPACIGQKLRHSRRGSHAFLRKLFASPFHEPHTVYMPPLSKEWLEALSGKYPDIIFNRYPAAGWQWACLGARFKEIGLMLISYGKRLAIASKT